MKRRRNVPMEIDMNAVIARIRELSRDGFAPTYAEYNAARGDLPNSKTIVSRGLPWSAVIKMAGLRSAVGVHKTQTGKYTTYRQLMSGDRVPADLETEIRAALESGDNAPIHHQEWPLQCIPTRLEVRDYPQPDGSILRVTRTYASIR